MIGDRDRNRLWDSNDVFDFDWNYIPSNRYGPLLQSYYLQLRNLSPARSIAYSTGTAKLELDVIKQCLLQPEKRSEWLKQYRFTGSRQGLPYLTRLVSLLLLSPAFSLEKGDTWRFLPESLSMYKEYKIILTSWWQRLGQAFGQLIELQKEVENFFQLQLDSFTCIADIEVELLCILSFLQYELGLRFPIELYRSFLLPFAPLMLPDLLKYISTLHH